MPQGAVTSLYVHVPFCTSFCSYCSFPREVVREGGAAQLLRALEVELRAVAPALRGPLKTLYIGGGTPSCLGVPFLVDLFGLLFDQWSPLPSAEITLEANPEDVTPTFLHWLASSRVNRVSLGVQSFRVLPLLGRRHTPQRALEAVRGVAEVVKWVSLDLILGLPGSGLDDLEGDLERAVTSPVTHLSCYGLSVDKGTHLARQIALGEVTPLGEEAWAAQLEYAWERLEQEGFEQYEISNFARSGAYSRHNLNYWRGGNYLGLGAGAGSRLGRRRWYNPFPVDAYFKGTAAQVGSWSGAPPWAQELEELDNTALLREQVMTRLRTREGLPLEGFRSRPPFMKVVEQGQTAGLLTTTGGRCVLTRRGFLLSDALVEALFRTL